MGALVFVDVVAGPCPGIPDLPDLHDFGAVEYVRMDDRRRTLAHDKDGPHADPGPVGRTFRGTVRHRHPDVQPVDTFKERVAVGQHSETFAAFDIWLHALQAQHGSVSFVSDNVAFDWQWVNYYLWKHVGCNPFGHSGRRISDFYAGLTGDFRNTQAWKRLRRTRHDHNPVHDAIGNVEAFDRILRGER